MKIVVATDGSQGGKAAVQFTARIARSCRSPKILVVTVAALRREMLLAHATAPAGLTPWPELEKEEKELAERILAEAARQLAKHRVRARFRFLRPRRLGPAPEAIAREAAKERADMIVVGSEGYGAYSAWALGSVSQRLLHLAHRPVTVVHVTRKARR
jgi:nucleotide-binding universal stress UspA family protein